MVFLECGLAFHCHPERREGRPRGPGTTSGGPPLPGASSCLHGGKNLAPFSPPPTPTIISRSSSENRSWVDGASLIGREVGNKDFKDVPHPSTDLWNHSSGEEQEGGPTPAQLAGQLPGDQSLGSVHSLMTTLISHVLFPKEPTEPTPGGEYTPLPFGVSVQPRGRST